MYNFLGPDLPNLEWTWQDPNLQHTRIRIELKYPETQHLVMHIMKYAEPYCWNCLSNLLC